MSNEHFSVNTVKNFAKIKSDQNILQVKKPNKICLLPNNEIAKKSISKANEFKKLSKISNDIPILHKFELHDLSVQRPKKEIYYAKHSKNYCFNQVSQKVVQKSYCPAPPLCMQGCPRDHGPQKYELKTNSSGRGEGFQKTEKVIKSIQKEIPSKTANAENPPHIYCSQESYVLKKGPGGGGG